MGYDPQQPYSGYGQGPYKPSGEGWGESTPPPPPPGNYEPTQYVGVGPYSPPPPPPGYPGTTSTIPAGQYGTLYPQQPPRRSLRWLWITLAIVAGVIVLVCGGCVLVGVVASMLSTPDSTANDYYQAIEEQNYSQAYSYLAIDTLTVKGEKISATQERFALAAETLDQEVGTVTSHSIKSSSTSGDTATVVVHVTRSSGVSYDVHLELTKIDGQWKITRLDNL